MTDAQRQALTILAEGGSPEEAANSAGVSARTVYRWRSSPAFAAALLAASSSSIKTLFEDVIRLSEKSLTLLETVIDGPKKDYPTGVKLRAAQTALQHLSSLYELASLEDRLRRLEGMINEHH